MLVAINEKNAIATENASLKKILNTEMSKVATAQTAA